MKFWRMNRRPVHQNAIERLSRKICRYHRIRYRPINVCKPKWQTLLKCAEGCDMAERSLKLTVIFESRPGGGLRVWSDDLPGFVLSHSNIDGVLEDVKRGIETILSHRLGVEIEVEPLGDVREALEFRGVLAHQKVTFGPREFVAYRH